MTKKKTHGSGMIQKHKSDHQTNSLSVDENWYCSTKVLRPSVVNTVQNCIRPMVRTYFSHTERFLSVLKSVLSVGGEFPVFVFICNRLVRPNTKKKFKWLSNFDLALPPWLPVFLHFTDLSGTYAWDGRMSRYRLTRKRETVAGLVNRV